MKVAKLILLAALLALLPLSAYAAGPTVSLSPSPLKVSVGQVVPLAVKIDNVEGLYGFDMQLKFDPSIVEIQDANPGTAVIEMLPGDFLSYDIALHNEVNNATGATWIVVGQLNPSEAKSGSGTLFTLYVKGKAAGKSAFEITNAMFANRDGMEISVEQKAGQVEVVSAAASANTPAANPTQLPVMPTPQLNLTTAVEQKAQTPAAPAAVAPTATAPVPATAAPAPVDTAAPVATNATAQDAATPLPTTAPAALTSPTALAPAATSAVAPVETPAVTVAEAGSAPAATPASAEAAPATEQPAAQGSAASPAAPATTIVAAGGLNAPTRVESTTQASKSNTLLLAGGGLLLLAAAGAITLLVVRRGK